jgi:hypothetical protein
MMMMQMHLKVNIVLFLTEMAAEAMETVEAMLPHQVLTMTLNLFVLTIITIQ